MKTTKKFNRAVRHNLRRHGVDARRRHTNPYDEATVARTLTAAWNGPDAGGSAAWLALPPAEDPGGTPDRRPVGLDECITRLEMRALTHRLDGDVPVFLSAGRSRARQDRPAQRQHYRVVPLRSRGQHSPGGRIDAMRRLVG